MELLTLIFIIFNVLLVIVHLKNLSKVIHIPGPASLPLMGSFISLLKASAGTGKNAFLEPLVPMSALCKHYGNVMSVGLGSDQWVVLSGFEEIKAFSMNSEAVSRPFMPALNELYSFNKDVGLGVIFAHGDLWQDQRKFMAKTLKEMTVAVGGYKPFSEQISDEYNLFEEYLRRKCQSNPIFDGKTIFDIATLNIIWRLATGHSFDYEDQLARKTIEHVEAYTMEKTLGVMAGVHYAKYLPPFNSIFNSIMKHMKKLKSQVMSDMTTAVEDDSDTYVQRFWQEKEHLGVGNQSKFFTEEQLMTSLFDFFTGGSGTMSKTLSFCLLYMLHYPECQEQIRLEIISIQQHSYSDLNSSHLKQMPYTEAFILEVQRLSSVLPICPPRMVTSEIKIGGYKLYKGQQVQMNLYAMHRHEQHWGTDADKFRPHRFLDENHCVKHDEWLQPFGYGKRKCLGESVAKTTVFLFLVNMVKDFKFTPVSGSELPDCEPVGGLTLMPKDFEVQIEPIAN